MQTTLHDPTGGVYATTAEDAHALEVRDARRLLFVSGTMGLDAAGAAPATLAEQLDLVWRTIAAILASADMTVEHVVRVTSYLRDPADADANAAARLAALHGRVVPTTAIVVGHLSDDWLVEVEVVAAA